MVVHPIEPARSAPPARSGGSPVGVAQRPLQPCQHPPARPTSPRSMTNIRDSTRVRTWGVGPPRHAQPSRQSTSTRRATIHLLCVHDEWVDHRLALAGAAAVTAVGMAAAGLFAPALGLVAGPSRDGDDRRPPRLPPAVTEPAPAPTQPDPPPVAVPDGPTPTSTGPTPPQPARQPARQPTRQPARQPARQPTRRQPDPPTVAPATPPTQATHGTEPAQQPEQHPDEPEDDREHEDRNDG